MRSLTDRVMTRVAVDESGADECWLWLGTMNDEGYGVFTLYVDGERQKIMAHRLVYQLLVGPFDESLTLDHLCRVHGCVRPSHLEPCGRVENILRGVGPTAVNARKTHCIHGHPLTDGNTYRTRQGNRHCRECALRRAREHKARRKANV